MSGVSTKEPRWKTCAAVAQNTFSMAVGRMFVDKYFDKTAKLTVSSGRYVYHKIARLWQDGRQGIDDSYDDTNDGSVFTNSYKEHKGRFVNNTNVSSNGGSVVWKVWLVLCLK